MPITKEQTERCRELFSIFDRWVSKHPTAADDALSDLAVEISEAAGNCLGEITLLATRVEELEKALVLIGERAVVDWDDQTVGDVDKAVKDPKKYRDWLAITMNLAAENATLKQVWIPTDQTVTCAICGWIDWEPANDGKPHPTSCPIGAMEAELAECKAKLDKCEGALICAETERDVLKLKMKGEWPK